MVHAGNIGGEGFRESWEERVVVKFLSPLPAVHLQRLNINQSKGAMISVRKRV